MLVRSTEATRESPARPSGGSSPTIAGTGDRLVSIHRARARARYTGIDEEGPLAYVWTFRDGKVIHFRSYRDPDEALAQLAAAG